MTKKYVIPMLQIVSVKENDIVTASESVSVYLNTNHEGTVYAPGQRGLDDWDAGY